MDQHTSEGALDPIWAAIDLEHGETPIAHRPITLLPGLMRVPWWVSVHPRVGGQRRAVKRLTGMGMALLTDRRIAFRSVTFTRAVRPTGRTMVFRWADIESWTFDSSDPRPGRTGLAVTVRDQDIEQPGVFTFLPARPFPVPETDFFQAFADQLEKHVGRPTRRD